MDASSRNGMIQGILRHCRTAGGGALALAALLLALGAGPAAAQEPAPRDTVRAAAPAARGDTVRVAAADTVRGITPKGAFIRSLIIPGWGQSAVGAPGRGAVYFAAEAGSLWMFFKSRAKLQDARAVERALRESGELTDDVTTDRVSSREGQAEDWAAIAIFLLLFSGADAFVSAHLADFDRQVGLAPGPTGGVSVRASVPVGGRR